MLKSTDVAVFDFFTNLLQEPDVANVDSTSNVEIYAQPEFIAKTAFVQEVKPEAKPYKPAPEVKTDVESLTKLLAPVLEVKTKPKQDIKVDTKVEIATKIEVAPSVKVTQKPKEDIIVPTITEELVNSLDDKFQVLFFDIAGLTLAVPLINLGGIIKIETISHLIGQPSWFMGVQFHNKKKLKLVNTAAWVMPEKYEQISPTICYEYIIKLGNSEWGLACERLLDSIWIEKKNINWRNKTGKRPWLAGVVPEKMCGILNVDYMIKLLDKGSEN